MESVLGISLEIRLKRREVGLELFLDENCLLNPYVLSSYAKEQLTEKRSTKRSHNDAHLMAWTYDTMIVPIVDNSEHGKDHVDGEDLESSVY